MKAFQLISHGVPGHFDVRDVPETPPGSGEALVEVVACGLNHLDLWLEEGALPIPVKLPRTPGCEIGGRVAAVASDVGGWQPGDRVAVQSNLFCGRCESCLRGEESFCRNAVMLGVERDGGFAQKVVVPARTLVRLPDAVSCESAAALGLAASTAMHMLTRRTTVNAGDWVLVMGGASGVGSAAIQIARSFGARVISTGSTESKRQLALSLGAEFVVDSSNPAWAGEIRRLTGKRGVDLVVEHVGGPVLQQVLNCLARGGTVVTCGATAGKEVSFNLWPFFVKQQRLIGSYSRDSAALRDTLDWAAAGRLKPVIDATFPLDRAAEALARLRERRMLGKLLVAP
jgi:2-desacetyl-2-hydroxyethyl bacteriochlorophyllide A dehydrogenase